MNNISYYNSDRLIFWKILGIKIINLKKEKKEKFPIFKTTYSLGPLQVKKSGCGRALYIGFIPVIGIVFKGNQKIAINLFGMTLCSLKRNRRTIPDNANAIREDRERTKKRLYINIGNLPYSDGRTGIPRVAKKILEEGLKDKDIEVLPVYFERDSLQLKIANNYLCEKYGLKSSIIDDEVITINSGDVLLNVLLDYIEVKGFSPIFKRIEKINGKVFFTIHDIMPLQYPQYFKELTARRFEPWLRETLKYNGIITVSKSVMHDLKKWIEDNGIKLKDNFTIDFFYLGADFKKNTSISLTKDESAVLKEITTSPYFIQVSTIEPRKGYEQLLGGFTLLWEKGFPYNLVFVGSKGWKVDDLCKKIEESKYYNKKLFWLSGVSDNFLVSLYKNSNWVIFASHAEGFGLALIEGLYFGKPVLARDIAIFREIGGNNVTYFSGNGFSDIATSVEYFTNKSYTSNKNFNIPSWESSFRKIKSILF